MSSSMFGIYLSLFTNYVGYNAFIMLLPLFSFFVSFLFTLLHRLCTFILSWSQKCFLHHSLFKYCVRKSNIGCVWPMVCIQAAFMLQVKGLLMWVRKHKQICIHTYINTHTLFVKNFSQNQACAHSWPTADCGHTSPILKSTVMI